MLQHHHIQVNSDIYALAKLQEWFQGFQKILPRPVWMQCNLVLVEVFTNVVSYAHAEMPEDTPIDIDLLVHPSRRFLELRIWDHGQPFDLEAEIERLTGEAQAKQHTYDVDDIPTGGRGLIIAKTVADDIRYEVAPDGRNCFVMTKSFMQMNLLEMPQN